mmetsp:Transcript_3126/g.6255  ORF Transcript_3126/g.6255 Transcript_3126/m.6255 type:complete len:277 (+) Transcript_3126:364-1194(+)
MFDGNTLLVVIEEVLEQILLLLGRAHPSHRRGKHRYSFLLHRGLRLLDPQLLPVLLEVSPAIDPICSVLVPVLLHLLLVLMLLLHFLERRLAALVVLDEHSLCTRSPLLELHENAVGSLPGGVDDSVFVLLRKVVCVCRHHLGVRASLAFLLDPPSQQRRTQLVHVLRPHLLPCSGLLLLLPLPLLQLSLRLQPRRIHDFDVELALVLVLQLCQRLLADLEGLFCSGVLALVRMHHQRNLPVSNVDLIFRLLRPHLEHLIGVQLELDDPFHLLLAL